MIVASSDRRSESPLDAYAARRDARRGEARRLGRVDGIVAGARLAVFVGAIVIAALALKGHRFSGLWLLAPAGAFLCLIVVHARVIGRRERVERAVRLYDESIARVEDRAPPGDGRSGRFGDEAHPYAVDLDLFGAGSLFERLSTARTSLGEETLAAWLKAPAPPAEVRDRQQAVADLAPRLDLKEDLAVLGTDLGAQVNPTTLAAWAAGPSLPLPPGVPGGLMGARLVSAVVGLVITTALIAWAVGRAGALPFVITALLGTGWAIRLRVVVRAVVFDADHRAAELKLVATLLARLERERFMTPLLARLGREIATATGGAALPPSRRVARLARLVDLLDARRNQVAAILTAPLLWTTQLALAVEGWRRAFGPAVARWLAAIGEIEALASLSTFAFEHQELPFPEVRDEAQPARCEGEAIGHPLLPARTRITNDVALGAAHPRLLIVSGSNMSGKSTLLRTVGVNVVLALAGAPVCANRFVVSRLAIGGTLRIHDSLQEGRSRFYAEITRLRQIVDLAAGPIPALFLVDELLSGTNSHDRRVGAQGILRGLVARGAIGLATTHDLALTEMTAAFGSAAANVHFEDEMRDGRMRFDYRMRPGVVQNSNALALMRAVGLEVELEPPRE